jgi:hypothetical protein
MFEYLDILMRLKTTVNSLEFAYYFNVESSSTVEGFDTLVSDASRVTELINALTPPIVTVPVTPSKKV